jgi:isoleucyl-tRNA synthetase
LSFYIPTPLPTPNLSPEGNKSTPTIDRLINTPQIVAAQKLFQDSGNAIGATVDLVVETYKKGWRLIGNLLLLLTGGISLYIAIELIKVVNRIPFVETGLKSVGLVMSVLFVSRNLLTTAKRKATFDRAIAYKNTIIGAQMPVERIVSTVEDTGELVAPTPVTVTVEPLEPQRKSNGIDELRYLFLASQVELINDDSKLQGLAHQTTIEGGKIGVTNAEGVKCDRCWNYSPTVGHNSEHPAVCDRCVDALAGEF